MEDERDLSKSWPNGRRNFRSLAVQTVRNCGSKASDLKSPGRAEVQKLNFIFGSQGRTDVRKRDFISYETLTEQRCRTDFLSHH